MKKGVTTCPHFKLCQKDIVIKTLWYCNKKGRIVQCKWRRQWQPTPVLLPGKSCGWRSLVDYSPWGHKELDMTERLHFHFHTKIQNPLGFLCVPLLSHPPFPTYYRGSTLSKPLAILQYVIFSKLCTFYVLPTRVGLELSTKELMFLNCGVGEDS